MKTNHRRGYVDPGSFREHSCEVIMVSKITGKFACIGNDFTNGHRGHAKAVRGAKKYIRSRDRMANKQLAKAALEESGVLYDTRNTSQDGVDV
jgi:hypothetical protein